MPADNSAGYAMNNFVYPTGAVFVRCGWVPDAHRGQLVDAVAGTVVTFDNPLADK